MGLHLFCFGISKDFLHAHLPSSCGLQRNSSQDNGFSAEQSTDFGTLWETSPPRCFQNGVRQLKSDGKVYGHKELFVIVLP